jgi:hypothetical protein
MESSDFVFYNNSWIKKKHLVSSQRIEKTEAQSLMKDQGLYVRNTYNWDKTDKPYFWYVIKDGFGGVEELPSKARNQVRKSLKTYEFKIVPFKMMMSDGYGLFNKSRERFGNNLTITKEEWKARLQRDDNSEFWIGYDIESGKPASFAINTIFDDYVDYSTMGISPDFPNNTYPMYGLIYEMNRYYLEEKKVSFVCDGARSITEHSNIQLVLEEKFKFHKAYCDLQVFYKPWLGIAVRLLFPFRNLIKHSKVAAILRQEAWARGLEK